MARTLRAWTSYRAPGGTSSCGWWRSTGYEGGAGAASGDLAPFYMIIDPDNLHPPETAH